MISVQLGDLFPLFAKWCDDNSFTHSAGLRVIVNQQLKFHQHGPVSVSNPRLRIKLDGDIEKQLNAARGSRNVSAFVRDLIKEQLLRNQFVQTRIHAAVQSQEGQTDRERVRVELKLSKSEWNVIESWAQQMGVVPATRLTLQIIRGFLLHAIPSTEQNKVSLGTINTALIKIGTNLNQIARQLNQERVIDAAPFDQIQMMIPELRECVQQISLFLSVHRERWQIKTN